MCSAGNSNSLKKGVDIEFFDDFYCSTHFSRFSSIMAGKCFVSLEKCSILLGNLFQDLGLRWLGDSSKFSYAQNARDSLD